MWLVSDSLADGEGKVQGGGGWMRIRDMMDLSEEAWNRWYLSSHVFVCVGT